MKWTPERRAAHAALLRELWSDGIYANRQPPRFRSTARCGICASPKGLRHFSLTIQVKYADGRHGTKGAGAIDLCRRCWTEATGAAVLKRRPALRQEKAA